MTTHQHPTTDPQATPGCGGCGGRGSPRPADGCGCDSEEICTLECLERPLFTAGMVLSDSDLTALVGWTSDRLGLQRYRHGWGVVCGLDVRCDPDAPGRVVVEPGYAVGCCGEDVVLCEAQKVDLTECCVVESPCDDPTTEDRDADGEDTDGEDTHGEHTYGKHTHGQEKEKPLDRAGSCGDVVVDVVLTPWESPAVAGLVPGCGCGGGCGGGRDGGREGGCGAGCGGGCGSGGCSGGCDGGCDGKAEDGCRDQRVVPTRVREGGRVCAVKVSFPDADPVLAAAERAAKEYARCHEVVRDYIDAGGQKADSKDAIVEWLRRQDIDPPCDWWTTLCAALDEAETGDQADAAVAAALFDLVADCRHRWLRRRCASCTSESIGLARVWLRRVEDRSGQSCVVTHVDAYPPYRRELGLRNPPMPAGAEDLAPFVWQRWEQVCSRWRRLAPETRPVVLDLPGSTSELLDLLDETANLWWSCDALAPTPVVVRTACLGERVVGFWWRRDNWSVSHGDSTTGTAEDVRATAAVPPGDETPEPGAAEHIAGKAAAEDAGEASLFETVKADQARASATRLGLSRGLQAGPASAGEPPAAGVSAEEVPEEPAAPGPAWGAGPGLESVPGLGAGTAEKLRSVGISTVEELALTDPRVVAVIIAPNRNFRAIHDAAVRIVGTVS